MTNFATDPSAVVTPMASEQLLDGLLCGTMTVGQLNWLFQQLFSSTEQAAAVIGAGIGVLKTTRGILDADLAHDANTIALVYADPTEANNDFYIKTGASGAGAWTLTTVLHGSIAALANPFVTAAQTAATLAQTHGFQLEPLNAIGSTIEEDLLGRISRILLPDGGQYIAKMYRPGVVGLSDKVDVWAELAALTISVATASANAAAAAISAPLVEVLNPIGFIVEEDSLGRVSRIMLTDGGQYITKLYRPGTSGLANKRNVWDEIDSLLDATAVPGKTNFQKTVLPSMAEGKQPLYTPPNVASPAITPFDTGFSAMPVGYSSYISWNSPLIRREGGVWHNDGPNGWAAVSTLNQSTYANSTMASGFGKVCLACRMELEYDGDELIFAVLGGGASFRIIVDGKHIEQDDGRIIGFAENPPDGQYRRFKLALGSAAQRTIMWEFYGTSKIDAIWAKTGAQFGYPTSLERPKVYFDGTSVVESGAGWYRHFIRIMNVDGWNAGVGGSGIFNPGPGGRDHMWGRKNWLHADFAYGIHQGIINDSLLLAGGDGSYADGYKRYADRYRFILDSWGTRQNGRPWFALGYFPNEGFPPEYYAMRDGMEQAVSEFDQFACMIDPLPHDGTFPSNATVQGYYLNTPTDPTHPAFGGPASLGRRIARQVGDLIRSGRF